MSYFESLLEIRGLNECPLPLWKLKITDSEYEELKRILVERARALNRNCSNRFITVRKECTLFFAEYWRREYTEQPQSYEMVFNALNVPNYTFGNDDSRQRCVDEFVDSALKGAALLKIEIYKGKKTEKLDSMLYQGGLPMKLVTENRVSSNWYRFAKGLVNRKANFDELRLGIVATNNQGLKEFCDQLFKGVAYAQYKNMPFFCQNEYDEWYVYLRNLYNNERIYHEQSRPFAVSFEFRIDAIEKRINVDYIVKGQQQLSESFVEEQHLQDLSFFSVQVKKNDKAVDTFDYANKFCHYAVMSRHPYLDGDYITVFLHDQKEPHIGDDLDMHIPHILFKNKSGKYEVGNKLGQLESLILVPEGWSVDNPEGFNIEEYTWETMRFDGIRLNDDFEDKIVIRGTDGAITFASDSPLYWTEICSRPVYQPNIVNPVYDAEHCGFRLCYEEDDFKHSNSCHVQYRNKWQSEWSDTPSYGEIFARAIDRNGNYVAPIRFINIGSDLSISLQRADNDSCRIRITWPHGSVTTSEGVRRANDVWEIDKKNCPDQRIIHFTFTPNENGRNQFGLSVKAPFKDFSLTDIDGSDIKNDSWIPYADLDNYQYHLVGQNIREYTYGNKRRELRWNDDELRIIEEGREVKTIPYEGSLLTLFDSREALRAMLERTSKKMIHAEIPVNFVIDNDHQISFSIKDSPYLPKQTDDGHVVVYDKDDLPAQFKGVLKLIKLDEPSMDAEEMRYDNAIGGYVLPETIRSWGRTLLFGNARGRIRPIMVDLTTELDYETRMRIRESSIAQIDNGLRNSTLGDELWQRVIGWFYRAQEEGISANSVLELSCTAHNYKSLLCLAFQLFAQCSNDKRDTLRGQLKAFADDLAFQWYWLQPYLSSMLAQLSDFIKDTKCPFMSNVYLNWALAQGDQMMTYIVALNDENAYLLYMAKCLNDVFKDFTDWMRQLCISSMLETYGMPSKGIEATLADNIIKNSEEIVHADFDDIGYIVTNQDDLGEEAVAFFEGFEEANTYGNETWLYPRVNAVVAHIRQERDLDLFIKSEEIRRSIIYCSKSSNKHFIILLYNKLKNRLAH